MPKITVQDIIHGCVWTVTMLHSPVACVGATIVSLTCLAPADNTTDAEFGNLQLFHEHEWKAWRRIIRQAATPFGLCMLSFGLVKLQSGLAGVYRLITSQVAESLLHFVPVKRDTLQAC